MSFHKFITYNDLGKINGCRTSRHCSEDCVLNGVQFKKGALVILDVDTIHHDPKVWPDPEVFNPDR